MAAMTRCVCVSAHESRERDDRQTDRRDLYTHLVVGDWGVRGGSICSSFSHATKAPALSVKLIFYFFLAKKSFLNQPQK